MMLEEDIIGIISSNLHIEKEKIKKSANLTDDLGADSIDQIEIQIEIEEKYKINIPDESTAKLKTVGDIIYYVSTHYKWPSK